MWLAPQLMIHTSVPDNDPVKYTLIENGVKLTPEPQEILGVQPYMKVTMPLMRQESVLKSGIQTYPKKKNSTLVGRLLRWHQGVSHLCPLCQS